MITIEFPSVWAQDLFYLTMQALLVLYFRGKHFLNHLSVERESPSSPGLSLGVEMLETHGESASLEVKRFGFFSNSVLRPLQ